MIFLQDTLKLIKKETNPRNIGKKTGFLLEVFKMFNNLIKFKLRILTLFKQRIFLR